MDGEDISGSYLLLEAHNTPTLGPRIRLAPRAKTDDGLIDVVRIKWENRDSLLNYLSGLATGSIEDLPSVEIARGKRLQIKWTGFNIHVDEVVRTEQKREENGSDDSTEAGMTSNKSVNE